jgi:hypothetical protein
LSCWLQTLGEGAKQASFIVIIGIGMLDAVFFGDFITLSWMIRNQSYYFRILGMIE